MSANSTTSDPSAQQVTIIADEDAKMLEGFIVIIATKGALYGLHVVLALGALFILLRKGLLKSPFRFILFIALLWMLIDSTVYIIVSILYYTVQIRGAAVTPYNFMPLKTKLEILTMIFPRIDYVIGDAIVVWRAWVLFERWSIPRITLFICLTGTIVTTFVDLGLNIRSYPETLNGAIRLIMPLPLLITNFVATSLIAYKAWQYRSFLNRNSSDRASPSLGNRTRSFGPSRSKVEGVLYLLVESGWVYCMIWMVAIIALFPVMPPSGVSYMSAILPFLTSIYPTIVIILVSIQKSPLHYSSQSPKDGVSNSSQATSEQRSAILFAPGSQVTPATTINHLGHVDLERSSSEVEK
ncbi:hypothetical protein K435DRAFT_475815 [Dendrothele bispora CBS 962.96]|uniref:Uncharacterized protein n=1 Tax=Dendrothele bispora (strain CBS 962.96) TaxID=1314807 RepID=A0A4S8KZH5_DENBC|nr:hypothetical protein K435DRAFT_475815 [Dendrothele bispora CBS 962.96]